MDFDSKPVLNLRAQSGFVSTHPASYSQGLPRKLKDKESKFWTLEWLVACEWALIPRHPPPHTGIKSPLGPSLVLGAAQVRHLRPSAFPRLEGGAVGLP